MIIKTRHNSYDRKDGYVVSWERGTAGAGHNVTMIDPEDNLTMFNWRAPNDPITGDQVTILMPATGISAKQSRPLLIMNQTTGDFFRQQNAPNPIGTRSIMTKLIVWIVIALGVSGTIIANTHGITMLALQLAAAAIIVWRLAIATFDLRTDDRTNQRKEDEDHACLKVLAGEWQKSPQARKPRIDVSHLLPTINISEEQQETENE